MAPTGRYEPAGPDIVSEEIDGEVIIVNLRNGNYYSLTRSATAIWAGIQRRATVEQIQHDLALRYSGESAAMEQGLTELIQALELEQLVAPCDHAEPGAAVDGAPIGGPAGARREAYAAPVFERFTDMGDLLLLDPVHEAEEQKGWPHAKGTA